jgi:hypothetical protein
MDSGLLERLTTHFLDSDVITGVNSLSSGDVVLDSFHSVLQEFGEARIRVFRD